MTVELGPTLFSARPLAEYRAMFALNEADLSGQVLDCPGGAASFTAEVCAAGGHAVAVDVIYERTPAELAVLARDETDRGNAYMAGNPDRYVWSYFPDVASHDQARQAAAEVFARDITAHPQRYVAGALPHLPFEDRSFDLILSGHLLFTYTDRLDANFHLEALLELVRVTRSQVRVFPLLQHTGHSDPQLLDYLCSQLSASGIHTQMRPVDYEFQRGGNQMLVLTTTTSAVASSDSASFR